MQETHEGEANFAVASEDQARADFYALLARLYAAGPDAALLSSFAACDELSADAASEGENWGLTVERKTGANYGVSHYRTALSFAAPEPGRGPKLQDMINALAATARKQPVVAQH